MKVGTLADSGAEARVSSIWISRWVVELISRWVVQVKDNLRFEFVRFWITGCVAKTYFGVWIRLICKNQWLAWTHQNQLRKRICCLTKHSFRFLDVFTYEKWDVSIKSNCRACAPNRFFFDWFLLILSQFFLGCSRWWWVCARTWWSIWWSEGGFTAPDWRRRVEIRLCSFGSLDVLIWRRIGS